MMLSAGKSEPKAAQAMIVAPPCPLPRVYRLKPWIAAVVRACGVAWCAGLIAFLYHLAASDGLHRHVPLLIVVAFSAAFAVAIIVAAGKNRVILDADGIAAIGLLGTRGMRHADIGARMFVFALWPTWSLLPKRGAAGKMMFEVAYDFDHVFWDWFETIPKADRTFFRSRRDPGCT